MVGSCLDLIEIIFFQMATDPGTGFSTGLQAKVRQVTLLLWAGGEYVQRQNFSAN